MNNTAQMAFLQTKYVKELHHICKDLNVIGYANLRKAEIISLILNYVADPSYGGKPINIGETMIKAQHLTPFSKGHKQENMLMGTLNENNVVDHLKQFVELHCENACGLKLTVLDNKEYGLVGYKDEGIVPKAQITSIDEVFRVKDTTNLASTTFFVGCEIKTKTTRDTEQTELEYIKTTLQNEVATFLFAAKLMQKCLRSRFPSVPTEYRCCTCSNASGSTNVLCCSFNPKNSPCCSCCVFTCRTCKLL